MVKTEQSDVLLWQFGSATSLPPPHWVKSVFAEDLEFAVWAQWGGHLLPISSAEERNRDDLKTDQQLERIETLSNADSLPVPRSSLFLMSDYILLP